jgi:membrane associated rhomboid family serine protease
VNEPDLFVVCKNCSSEVSPYVTECPYCGQRVRKRAPKIEKEGAPEQPPRRKRSRPPSLPRLRRDEIPGIALETRPWATIALIVLAALVTLAFRTGEVSVLDLGVFNSAYGEWWRLVTTPFVHDNLGYLFVAMLAVAIFGTHLERRFGAAMPVVLFLGAGVAGAALSVAVGIYPALGANGAALALLCAWLVEDRRALRRGEDRGNDLIGVYVIGAALVLLSLADESASIAAAAAGAAIGSLAGLALSTFRR